MIRKYNYHGVRIKIDSRIAGVVPAFEKTFGLRPEKSLAKPQITLLFRQRPEAKTKIYRKRAAQKFKLTRIRDLYGFYSPKRLTFTDKKTTVAVDYGKKRARFSMDRVMINALKYSAVATKNNFRGLLRCFTPRNDGHNIGLKKLFTHNILPLAMIELLKKFGFYYVHASCADIDGKGILFVGAPASGKTTACYSLVRRGVRWVSDDAVLIKRIGKRIMAFNFIKEFTLKTDKNSLFGELKRMSKGKDFKYDISKLKHINSLFKAYTVPKLIMLLDTQGGSKPTKNVKLSDMMGTIVRENEFLLLDKKFSNSVLKNLEVLGRQCNTMYLLDKNLIKDSHRFLETVAAKLLD